MSELFSPLVERAFRTAARFHRDQLRKASDLPYLIHPAGVMLILQRAGIDGDEVLAAALLHDVVEDTDCSLDDLTREFPPNVVQWVRETTERKRDNAGKKLSWIVRKREHLAHMRHASEEARAIVLADKLHNLASMRYDLDEGQEVWERFGAPAEHVLWYNREMIAAAAQDDAELQGVSAEAKRILSELIGRSGVEPREP